MIRAIKYEISDLTVVCSLHDLLFGDSLVYLAFSQKSHEPTDIQVEYLKIVNSTCPLQHLSTYLSQLITNFQSDHLLGLDHQLHPHSVLDNSELSELSS